MSLSLSSEKEAAYEHYFLSEENVLETLFTVEELSKLLNVAPRTLGRWHAKRIGPPRTKCGNFIRYRADAVYRWLEQNEAQPVAGRK